MFFDPIYMLILLVTAVLGGGAQLMVKRAFRRWSQVPTRSGMTGAQVARGILEREGIYDVQVERVGGFLSDHYDPRTKTLRLSPDVYDGVSVASAGVAAHEVGHALQHAQEYWPLQFRSVVAPMAAFGGNISIWLIIGGVVAGMVGLAQIGVALFAVMTLFTIITVPVEFDASRRAKTLLPAMGLTQGEEGDGVASVLNAAALTYLAAAVSSVMMLLYWAMQAGLLGRDD